MTTLGAKEADLAETFTSPLNDRAYNEMQRLFHEKDHNPSVHMMKSLRELQETLSAMLTGKAEDLYYLCSLDCGVGKSTAIIKWIDAYLQNPTLYGDKGIIIGLDRYKDIERFIEDCAIPKESYAVLVTKSNEALNSSGVGSENIDKAAILLTTKQQIKIRCNGEPFNSTPIFHYKGKARAVRIWDESLTVGKPLTLNQWDMGTLISLCSKHSNDAAKKVLKIMEDLKDSKDGDVYQMPELDISANELLYGLEWGTESQKDITEIFGLMLGKLVTVRKAGQASVLVDCVEELPNDFTPCLITDASGRIRATYRLQRRYRGDIKSITSPLCNKRYDKLTVNVWKRGSGKDHYARNGISQTADEIGAVIDGKPGEEFLIVLHKDLKNLRDAILKKLPNDKHRINFLTYGRHTATNEFSEIPNIIIASTFYYRVAHYEAIARASATKPTSEGAMTDAEIDRIKKGEAAHNLLQAVCRGKVRKAVGDGCPESEVWLIAHPTTGIPELLPKIFPHCTVRQWNTKTINLTGIRQQAYDYILNRLEHGAKQIPTLEVKKHLGIKDNKNFKRAIVKDTALRQKLSQVQVIVEKIGNRYYYIKADFEYYFGSLEEE